MAQANEQLIREVFGEMAKFRPSLMRYLAVDEDEDETDIRILADQIIQSYPWPIGVELRRLFSGTMRELNRGRLDQLFKTIERTMQFISIVLVIELYEEVFQQRLKLDQKFCEQFGQRFNMLSMGNFSWLVRTIGTILTKNNAIFFMPEMAEMCNRKFFAALDSWVSERNDIGHYLINLTTEEIEKRCVECQDRLAYTLKEIAFMAKYRMVTIREIKVIKPRNKDPRFEHTIDILNNSSSEFASREKTYTKFSDSNAVLIMKNIADLGKFLNLSPLIIDTRNETIDTKEKFSLKKDIFMYTKFKNDKIFHLGTEITETCDLSALSNYAQLLEEFKELMNSIAFIPEST